VYRLSQGDRAATVAFSSALDQTNGYAVSVTDNVGPVASWLVDARGRPLTTTFAGTSTQTQLSFDANGNILTVTPPNKPVHTLTYSPVDLLSSYRPPALAAETASTALWQYNLDRQLVQQTQLDGVVATLGYTAAGRLDRVDAPTTADRYTYFPVPCSAPDCAAGRLESAISRDGVQVSLGYDGHLVKSVTYAAGSNTASVGWTYDSNFNLRTESVGGAGISATIGPITYDADQFMTCLPHDGGGCGANSDALRIARDPQNGSLTSVTAGGLTESFTYDDYGQLASQATAFGGTQIFSLQYVSTSSPRDPRGRVLKRTRVDQQSSQSSEYEYDALDRLHKVKRDGADAAVYEYDNNGNRLSVTTPSGTVIASYDERDRLTAYGSVTYTYTLNGARKTRAATGSTTTYSYDEKGRTIQVTLGNGQNIQYLFDVFGHRVGKRVNGSLTKSWVYNPNGQLIAELDANGIVTTRFIYGSRANIPELVVRYESFNDWKTYRLLADQLGSPHLLVNVADVTDQPYRASYDEFGVVTGTGLDLIPFGFAGGLYDPQTSLVRFGARDYDPEVGRWLSNDPILFDGGQANLYAYVGNDPVNRIDPIGLYTEVIFWEPVGMGASSFGHVSVNVNGTTYSLAPGGIVPQQTSIYNARNTLFRSGRGLILGLSPAEEVMLVLLLSSHSGDYSAFSNNCTDPIEEGLGALGTGIGDSLLPGDTFRNLFPEAVGQTFHQGPKRLFHAPWSGPTISELGF
jgi:RHS repeat-associated protein